MAFGAVSLVMLGLGTTGLIGLSLVALVEFENKCY